MLIQFASETGFIIGFVTFLGLLLQRKPFNTILEATVKVIIGYIILQFGAHLAIQQLTEITVLLERTFSLKGIMPNNEMIVGISQWHYGKMIGYIIVIGMILHIVIARYTKYKYIFLTGHHILYMSSLLAGIMAGASMPFFFKVLLAGIILALSMTLFPAICQPMMRQLVPEQNVAIGHFGSVGYVIAGWFGKKLGKKDEQIKSKSKSYVKALKLISNPIVSIALFMLIFFTVVIIITSKQDFITYSGSDNALLYALNHSFLFTAAIYIIIVGVRMLLTEVLTSFQGIADKIVPDAIPALDSPVIFPKAPRAVVIGFSFSLIGGIAAMFALISLKVNIVLPAIVAHFISGGTAGVFGHTLGGYRGAAIGSFMHGLFITFLPLFLLPVMFQIGYTQTTFSETDFGIVGLLVYYVMKLLNLIQ